MNLENIPSDISVIQKDGRVKLVFEDAGTDFIDSDDEFIERISIDKLNPDFLENHLRKEFEIKNKLDEAVRSSNIELFDEVLFYDPYYLSALVGKSRVLKSQGHYIKALRTYRKAIRHGLAADEDYLNDLQKLAIDERDSLPEVKRAIFNGDHAFKKGKYREAVGFYDMALESTDKFRDKVLPKLLNKKGKALLELERYQEALKCFDESSRIANDDSSYFLKGYALYKLSFNAQDLKACETCLERIYADNIRECFERSKRITKRQLLMKAQISAELGCFDDALSYYGEFLENHFVCDDDCLKALKGREECLENLGRSH